MELLAALSPCSLASEQGVFYLMNCQVNFDAHCWAEFDRCFVLLLLQRWAKLRSNSICPVAIIPSRKTYLMRCCLLMIAVICASQPLWGQAKFQSAAPQKNPAAPAILAPTPGLKQILCRFQLRQYCDLRPSPRPRHLSQKQPLPQQPHQQRPKLLIVPK